MAKPKMDRGTDADIFHTCLILENKTESMWEQRNQIDFDGKNLHELLMTRDVMTDLTLPEAIITLRGRDDFLLTQTDMVSIFEPPKLVSFLKSEWGKQLNFWSASFLGITRESISQLTQGDFDDMSDRHPEWWNTTFGIGLKNLILPNKDAAYEDAAYEDAAYEDAAYEDEVAVDSVLSRRVDPPPFSRRSSPRSLPLDRCKNLKL